MSKQDDDLAKAEGSKLSEQEVTDLRHLRWKGAVAVGYGTIALFGAVGTILHRELGFVLMCFTALFWVLSRITDEAITGVRTLQLVRRLLKDQRDKK